MDIFKKQAKTNETVRAFITKGEFDKIHSLIPQLKKENEHVLSGIDEAVNVLIQGEETRSNVADFFTYLMTSKSSTLFQLYYSSLLFNPELYQLLVEKGDYETEHHYDHYLLFQAEDCEDEEAKTFALSVLSMLKDTLYAKEELEQKRKEKK